MDIYILGINRIINLINPFQHFFCASVVSERTQANMYPYDKGGISLILILILVGAILVIAGASMWLLNKRRK